MEIDDAFILNVFKDLEFGSEDNKEKYLQVLITPNAIKMYQTAFTSKNYDAVNNYDLYEFIGDAILGNIIVKYFHDNFPQLQCSAEVKTLSRLKIVHTCSESFSEIALNLNFLPRIKATVEELNDDDKVQHLLEDVFEAFIGVTDIILTNHFHLSGIGHQIVKNFIDLIFNNKTISFAPEDLYDAKTRLKELFDNKTDANAIYIKFISPIYEEYRDVNSGLMATSLYFKNNKSIKFQGIGKTKPAREKNAAQQALDYLKRQGFKTEKQFTPFCAN